MNQPNQSLKGEILSSIAKTDDSNLKMVLLLMLGVLDEIGSKIDSVMTDERAIKNIVLNGHSNKHHDHHDWVDRKIQEDSDVKALKQRADPLMDWVEQKMQEEERNKGSMRKVFESVFSHIAITAITALTTTIYLLK